MGSTEKAILVVSFGTTYNENRAKTIGTIESDICRTYPDWDVRRAFTSRMVINKLAKRDNKKVDHVAEAMDRLVADGIRRVVVQPTHIMNGTEYDDVLNTVSGYRDRFDSMSIGRPLLTTAEDYGLAVDAIRSAIVSDSDNIAGHDAAIVLMGHGTEHYANSSYSQLHLKLLLSGYPRIFVTTIDGFPDYADTVSLMKGKGYRKAALFPFMLVAGDHANKDMAGEEGKSLRSVMEINGYEVHCIMKGLGEYKEFRDLFLAHTEDAIRNLVAECTPPALEQGNRAAENITMELK